MKNSVYRRINSTPHLTTSYDDYLNHYQKLPKMKNIYNVSSSGCSFSPKGSDLKDVKKAFHSQASIVSNTSNSTIKSVWRKIVELLSQLERLYPPFNNYKRPNKNIFLNINSKILSFYPREWRQCLNFESHPIIYAFIYCHSIFNIILILPTV